MKRISHYSFGSITIDGKSYRSDVIVFPGIVNPSWWRREGHTLRPEDLEGVAAIKPSVVVIGTGASGAMQVPESTLKWLGKKGIEVKESVKGEENGNKNSKSQNKFFLFRKC